MCVKVNLRTYICLRRKDIYGIIDIFSILTFELIETQVKTYLNTTCATLHLKKCNFKLVKCYLRSAETTTATPLCKVVKSQKKKKKLGNAVQMGATSIL